MERQAELLQPVLEVREELLPIRLELAAEDHIVRIPADDHLPGCPTSSPLADPEVDDVVEEYIGKDWADPRPLRRACLHRFPLAALEDACLQPTLDQAKHPGVGDPVRQHPHQPSVVDGIEKGADVDIEHKERKFLGFSISNDGSERRIAPKALDKFKGRIRDVTRRTRGFSLQQLIKELKPYIMGWRGYFGFCQTPRVLTNLEAWIRRRLRLYLWRQW